jgi:hypothetical protein
MQTSSIFSQVRVSLMEKDSLRGLATVKAHDSLFLTGLRVVEGKNGLFVSMPNRKTAAGAEGGESPNPRRALPARHTTKYPYQ